MTISFKKYIIFIIFKWFSTLHIHLIYVFFCVISDKLLSKIRVFY